jgi:type VI secretion system secreted protein Hcp
MANQELRESSARAQPRPILHFPVFTSMDDSDGSDHLQPGLQPKSATSSTSGDHTAERCEHGDLVVTKLADLSSPILLQTCSSGKTIPKARLKFMRADGQGLRIKYYEIELENVLIGAVVPSILAGQILTKYVSLKYGKVKWKYTQQKVAGGAGGNVAGGWDLTTNRIC